jgi:RNA polymerase sigma-70 factor (ECF subfamily)
MVSIRQVELSGLRGAACLWDAGEAGAQDEGAADAVLLAAGQAGDRVALEALVARHKRALFGVCYGILRHADDAEDAVQETFLRALRGLPNFRGEAVFRTWIFRIALNVCLNLKRRHRPTEPWEDHRSPAATSPETIALRQLEMTEALGRLMPRHRAILLLKEREGWSVAEIGAAMGWNAKKVERELSRARGALAAWRQQSEGEAR